MTANSWKVSLSFPPHPPRMRGGGYSCHLLQYPENREGSDG